MRHPQAVPGERMREAVDKLEEEKAGGDLRERFCPAVRRLAKVLLQDCEEEVWGCCSARGGSGRQGAQPADTGCCVSRTRVSSVPGAHLVHGH